MKSKAFYALAVAGLMSTSLVVLAEQTPRCVNHLLGIICKLSVDNHTDQYSEAFNGG